MFLKIILLNFVAIAIASERQKRYLVYPDGGPARAQFIIGLGVPVDLKEASVTVGTVIKFQYDLPTNSSEYTERIYGFANTVQREMGGEVSEKEQEDNNIESDTSRDIDKIDDSLHNVSDTSKNNKDDDDGDDVSDRNNDTLVDITFDKRKKRSPLYSEGGYVNSIDNDEINTELPLQEAIRRQELIDRKHLEDEKEPQRMNRWDFYKVFEHMIERYGYSGRPCLLRTICEAAEVPFTYENGLLGEIGHILFTPSTSKDSLSHHTDNEYHAAERLGREVGTDCESLFPECESSILDTFTGIGMETLHKFGLY